MRKSIWVFTVIFLISFGPIFDALGDSQKKEVQQIESLVQDLVKAYNQRDEGLMQRIWAEDGDLVSTPGAPISSGKQKILEEIRQDQNTEYKGSKLSLIVTNIKFIGRNVALVEAKNFLKGIITPGGTKLPPVAHFMIIVVEKKRKEWLIDGIRYFSSLPILRPRS